MRVVVRGDAAIEESNPLQKKELEKALWAKWLSGSDPACRAQLIDFYSDWTRFIAKRIFIRVRIPGVEWADFMQLATVGLLESLDRFEPARGLNFTTYARHRVRGSILNGLRLYRDQTNGEWHSNDIVRVSDRTESLLGEEGQPDLLTEIVDITVGLAIGHFLDLKFLGTDKENDAYAAVENDLLMEDLAHMVEDLPAREAMIIKYHYYQQLPFVEIAELLGVTKGRVSQLHKQAVARLRKQLQSAGGWDIRA